MLRVVLSKDVCFVKGFMFCRRISVLSKDLGFVEGFLLCRRISVLPKGVCFVEECLFWLKDFCFVEGCYYHPPLGAFGPLFFFNEQCFVLCCRRMSVLSKDVRFVEGFMLGPRVLACSSGASLFLGC